MLAHTNTNTYTQPIVFYSSPVPTMSDLAPFVAAVLRDPVVSELRDETKQLREEREHRLLVEITDDDNGSVVDRNSLANGHPAWTDCWIVLFRGVRIPRDSPGFSSLTIKLGGVCVSRFRFINVRKTNEIAAGHACFVRNTDHGSVSPFLHADVEWESGVPHQGNVATVAVRELGFDAEQTSVLLGRLPHGRAVARSVSGGDSSYGDSSYGDPSCARCGVRLHAWATAESPWHPGPFVPAKFVAILFFLPKPKPHLNTRNKQIKLLDGSTSTSTSSSSTTTTSSSSC